LIIRISKDTLVTLEIPSQKALKKTKPKLTKWDSAKSLKTRDDMLAYLGAAFDDGDPALIAAAIGDVARAAGMTKVASEASLGRESLYKSLSLNGYPSSPRRREPQPS
jgi:probable addiction module antidote protein